MRVFDHATILSPSFRGLRKERLAQWPPFCVLNMTKNCYGTYTVVGVNIKREMIYRQMMKK